MTPNTRKPNESFEAYKLRRALHSKLDKVIGKGTLVHLSAEPVADGLFHKITYISPEGKKRILMKGTK